MTLNALWLSGLRAVAWLLVQEVFNWHHACTRLSLPLRGVVAPMDPRLESAREVCDRVLGAADDYIPPSNLGTTTDDCGCSPFCDDPPPAAVRHLPGSERGWKGRGGRPRRKEHAAEGSLSH